MIRIVRLLVLVAIANLVLPSGDAGAQRRRGRAAEVAPPLTLAVTPDADRAFHVRVAIDVAREGVAEAVGDLRWLSFEVTAEGARRPQRCVYSYVPTRNDPTKVVATPPSGSALVDGVVDLRMYCAGAAFAAIANGGRITPIYGVRSANATRFVARDADRRGRRTASVRGATFAFVPRPVVTPDDGLSTRLPSLVVGATRTITLRPSVVSARATRIYLRPDLWHFDVRAPDGRVSRCSVPRHPVVPILDFFARVRAGGAVSSSVDLAAICPGVVSSPGVYDIGAIAELVYDGGNVGLTAATGTIRGPLSFIRVKPPRDADPTEFVRPVGTPSNAL